MILRKKETADGALEIGACNFLPAAPGAQGEATARDDASNRYGLKAKEYKGGHKKGQLCGGL